MGTILKRELNGQWGILGEDPVILAHQTEDRLVPNAFVGSPCNVREFLLWGDSRSIIAVEIPVGHYTEP